MLFTDLEIKEEYRSLQDDIVGDFSEEEIDVNNDKSTGGGEDE